MSGRETDPLREIPGIGPVLAARLREAGFDRPLDLCYALPTRYERWRAIEEPASEHLGERVAVRGRVARVRSRRLRKGGGVTTLRVSLVGRDVAPPERLLELEFFGRGWLAQRLAPGELICIRGRLARAANGGWHLNDPVLLPRSRGFSPGLSVEPVYRRIPGVAPALWSRIVHEALSRARIDEELTARVLRERGMLPLPLALRLLHAPAGASVERFEAARRRVALVEALELCAAVRARRARLVRMRAWPLAVSPSIDDRIRARLPHPLSPEQESVVAEIAADIARPRPMARLLQGEVGTGKTLVALWACLAAIARGHKAILLAPTELLAEQHVARIAPIMAGTALEPVFLSSSLGRAEKRSALARLAAPGPCLAVGTHALLAPEVAVVGLALLVVDEQQRFGVAQRARLFRERDGRVPHVLVMSATPIPRTLATALVADLDLSEMREPPVPRAPILTRAYPAEAWPDVVAQIEGEVAAGGRAFVVCPRIDGATHESGVGARQTFDELRSLLRAGLLHGRMPTAERREVEEAFRSGERPCLVATSVVEVGLDVPEASLMVVRAAERFGLSTLHQLRGRVGRGSRPSRCLLLAESDVERLRVLERSSDGFEIAEADLCERGAGELAGLRQHGHTRLRCLAPSRDRDLLRLACRGLPERCRPGGQARR